MRHRLLRRAMPLPPPTPPAPRTPGIAGGRLFSSLPPPPPPLQSRRLDTDCKVDPGSFEFKKNKFGKPEILWQSDDNKMEWPLHFNISHTSSLIACGITMDNLIGIDIEEKKRKTAKNILSLARRYFTPSEVDYLAQIPDPDAQQKEFIKLWTLKEAYVKALGRGFSGAPFNKFSIEMEAKNGIRISVAPKVFKDSDSTCDCLSENWQFALAELNSSHYMAVCVGDDSRSSESGNGRLPLGLKVWKTVPFLEDTLVSGTEALTRIV
ncbi:L-aminoadipate-semialdehyde dehydrogenase-phosphopantetheinyl transferase-like isoform X5 [Panicum virgatum]|uniref:L-aminoadipate-semialdehyde dehydrogenase-phosphopantetheinyl transferase-like isoform X5 n=1 Tax=Panicum virgatum TaxID=38727 RepID=UPI0019D516AE|nr:L-aminoadipate-semialdehyde dehydrogenase-phosphopantetheinyl transferase-like isoform X5 [Panicum virgatum]